MPISRPFAYNPTLQTDGVSEQFGTLAVGFIGQSYGNQGGLKWWNGPDEELGYSIGTSIPSGGPIAPDGTPSTVGFWRSNGLNLTNYLNLSESVANLKFNSAAAAAFWFRSNGYWTSINATYYLLVGGEFTSYQSTSRNRISKLRSDASYDTRFNIGTGFSSSIFSIITQSDDKILIGGQFTEYSGISSNRVARLNTNGTYDSTFNIGGGFNASVRSISILNNDIYAGGDFSSYDGLTQKLALVKINPDGSIVLPYFGSALDGIVNTTAFQSDEKQIVGGAFTLYNLGTETPNRICRLDSQGNYDSTFNIGSAFNSTVHSIKIQNNSKILVGGEFTTYQGSTRNRIIRLNSDASYDSTFDLGSGFNGIVYTISIQTDGKIIVGGDFTTYQGVSRNRIVRLNTDGSYDNTFNIGSAFNSIVYTSQVNSDGRIFIGGQFTSYNGSTRNRISLINTDGSLNSSFDPQVGFNFPVRWLQIIYEII